MTLETKDVWVNFRVEKSLQQELDVRAKKMGLSRAELARQYFRRGVSLPVDVPQTFALLLYEKTSGMNKASKVREIAITTLKEMFQ